MITTRNSNFYSYKPYNIIIPITPNKQFTDFDCYRVPIACKFMHKN